MRTRSSPLQSPVLYALCALLLCCALSAGLLLREQAISDRWVPCWADQRVAMWYNSSFCGRYQSGSKLKCKGRA